MVFDKEEIVLNGDDKLMLYAKEYIVFNDECNKNMKYNWERERIDR